MCPHGPYSVDYRNRGLGVKVGGQAPRLKILNFWTDTLVLYFGPLFFLHCDSRGGGSKRVNWKKVLSPYNPPKMGFENFRGNMALFWFASSEGGTPHPSGSYYTPVDPGFKWGNCPPFGGDMGVWKFGNFWMGAWATPPGSESVQRSMAKFYLHGCL